MAQTEQVAEYIRKHGSISPLEAQTFGCMRLASRISDLKRAGVDIGSYFDEHINQRGERKRFKRYFFTGESNGRR